LVAIADPATGRQGLEQATIDPVWGAQIGILDHCILAQSGYAQPSAEPLVVARGDLAVNQQPNQSSRDRLSAADWLGM
jgi:hypothetical protein